MMTSFGALVYFGLQFNERETNPFIKWLISFPMSIASVAARGFTIAVFLKETTLSADMQSPSQNDKLAEKSVGESSEISASYEWIGGMCVIIVYFALNVIAFRICQQDYIRYQFGQ